VEQRDYVEEMIGAKRDVKTERTSVVQTEQVM